MVSSGEYSSARSSSRSPAILGCEAISLWLMEPTRFTIFRFSSLPSIGLPLIACPYPSSREWGSGEVADCKNNCIFDCMVKLWPVMLRVMRRAQHAAKATQSRTMDEVDQRVISTISGPMPWRVWHQHLAAAAVLRVFLRHVCLCAAGVLLFVLMCAFVRLGNAQTSENLTSPTGEDDPGGAAAFLSEALPLKIAATTPSDLVGSSSPLHVIGQQAITVGHHISQHSPCDLSGFSFGIIEFLWALIVSCAIWKGPDVSDAQTKTLWAYLGGVFTVHYSFGRRFRDDHTSSRKGEEVSITKTVQSVSNSMKGPPRLFCTLVLGLKIRLSSCQVPFVLVPDIPGRFRWVTTYIARWDPDGSWPLDSELTLQWNKNLKTHDGNLLQTVLAYTTMCFFSAWQSAQMIIFEGERMVCCSRHYYGWWCFSWGRSAHDSRAVNEDCLGEIWKGIQSYWWKLECLWQRFRL